MIAFEDLPRERLISILDAWAANWLAHDGLWFQAVERAHGLDEAVRLDAEAWSRFSPIEARRIMKVHDIAEGGGLAALEQALGYRLYAALNRQRSEWIDGKLRFWMVDCRVQTARARKGLPDFPCKQVGLVEYSTFASTVDPRIRTRCIACPPDERAGDFCCGWEFDIEGVEGT